MFSQEVQITFSLAVREAQRRHHEYLTSEHLLYAMLFEEQGQEIIINCGGDLEQLRKLLEQFFSEKMESLPGEEEFVPEQTIGLQRILQRTVLHMQSSGKKEVSVGDLLAAILDEKKSFASHFLSEQGVSRIDVLNYISHGVSKLPTPNENEAAPSREGGEPEKEGRSNTRRNPLEAFTVDLLERVRAGIREHIDAPRNEPRTVPPLRGDYRQ